jgi:uroporphyrinogen-III synthase
MASPDLTGLTVVVTRPAGQGETLAQQLAAAGATPLLMPALVIEPVTDPQRLAAARDALAAADTLIFISPNAVRYGLPLMAAPAGKKLFAVGEGTARALRAQGIAAATPAAQQTSEGLLALPALQTVHGQSITIVRGVGGRELLIDGLRARGARVALAEVYRRDAPSPQTFAVLRPLWENRTPLLIALSSADALHNLVGAMTAADHDALLHTTLLVTSARLRDAARDMGFATLLDAEGTDDDAIVDAAARWWREQRHRS